MPVDVRIHVLGSLEVVVGGEHRTERLTEPQRTLVAILAGSGRAVQRQRLRAAAGLAPTSMDAELSRIRRRLGLDRHLHRSRSPAVGWISLAPDVWVDADEAERALESASGARRPAAAELELVERLWRGAPLPRVVDAGVTATHHDDSLLAQVRARAWRVRHRHVELAVAHRHDLHRLGADPDVLARWATDHPTHVPARLAQLELLADRFGVAHADEELARWVRSGAPPSAAERGRAIIARVAAERPPLDALGSVIAAARRGLDRLEHRTVSEVLEPLRSATDGLDRWRVLLTRADAMRLGARWDEAELEFRAAMAEAEKLGAPDAAAETLLAAARIVWQPGQLADFVETHARRLIGDVDDPGVAVELSALIAGGLYQSGEITGERADLAARAIDGIDDVVGAHRRAEALVRARKGRLGLDPPATQLARSGRILDLAGERVDLRSAGLLASVVDHLHAADVDAAERVAAEHAALARTDPTGIVGFHQANLDAVFALHHGAHELARDRIDRLQAMAPVLGRATVDQIVFAHRYWLARASGDRASLELVAESLQPRDDAPRHPVWDAAHALVLTDVGRDVDARTALDRLVDRTDGLRRVPAGPHRLPTLALAALALHAAGRSGPDRAPLRHRLLTALANEPLDGVLIGWPTVYLGSRTDVAALLDGSD